MNIKYFPPIGTRSSEKVSDSEQTKVSAENVKSGQLISKDVFEQTIRGTVDQLVSKSKTQESHTNVESKKLEPVADCEPGTRRFAAKKLELAGNCITFRTEVTGSCIPMKNLEPVADCEPMTEKPKQQQFVSQEKNLTKSEK